MDADKVKAMADCMKLLGVELNKLTKLNAVSGNFANSASRKNNAAESARVTATQIRRLQHEAHCLAVELGLADRRDDAFYSTSTIPMGFGRVAPFEKRTPCF